MSLKIFSKVYFLFALILFSCQILKAQVSSCGITIDAGADQYFCQPGQVLQLQGQVSGDFLSASWTPAVGLSNPNALQTTWQGNAASVLQLNVQSLIGPELVTNGDFSLGNSGFSSNYSPGVSGQYGPVSNPGTFGITTAANLVHSQFAPCTDHSGGGRMMVVNGATTSTNVWCQTIEVNPETDYAFSAWFAVVATQNPSAIRFTVNGVAQGQNFSLANAVCNWNRFFRIWNSGQSTSAQICIRNVSTSSAGNDFCLDDISFRQICRSSDTVSLLPAVLNASFEIPAVLCENSATFPLNNTLSAAATPGGDWAIDGIPAQVFNPAETGPGFHQVSYRVSSGNCAEEVIRTIRVISLPEAGSPAAPLEICTGEIRQISLFELLNGADSGGIWTEISPISTPIGAFEAAAGRLFTQNLSEGNYIFRYTTSQVLPCPMDTAVINVHVRQRPNADAGADQTLDCRMRQVSIGGNQTEIGQGITYQWSSPDGGIFFQQGLPFTDTDRAGTYILKVSRGTNGCSDRDTVLVRSVISEPAFSITIKPVTCSGDSDGQLAIAQITEATPPFLFSLNGGAPTASMQFSGLSAGNYSIRLEDSNGCEATLPVFLPDPPPLTLEIHSNLSGQVPMVHLGDSATLDLITNLPEDAIQSVRWMPEAVNCENCTRLRISPFDITTYRAGITDIYGCSTEAAITIRVDRSLRLFIPEAFTPNGDGTNDVFMPFGGAEVAQIRNFTIADRWGNLLFEKENFPPSDPAWGWDGKTKEKPMEAGIYIYVLEALLVNGKSLIVSGDVTLLR